MGNNRLEVKDLINIGLFTALYFIIITPIGIAGIIPVIMFFLPALMALIGAIPLILLVARTQKFGALSISGIIVSLILFIMGHPAISLLTGITMPLLGDFIMYLGKYKKWLHMYIGYAVFSFWSIGSLLPFYFMREVYFQHLTEKYGTAYTQTLDVLFTWKTVPIIFVLCALGAVIGLFITRKLFKKHFSRAGII